MASVRKRTWTSGGQEKTAWLVAYRDAEKARRFETFPTKRQADSRRKEIENELVRGVHTAKSTSITVANAADLWLQHCEAEGLEPATMIVSRNNLKHHLLPMIGHYKLAELSVPMIEDFRDKLLQRKSIRHPDKTIARPTVRKVMSHLKSILTEAQRRGLVAQNVAQPVRIDLKSRDQKKLRIGTDIPTKEEVNAILNAAHNPWRTLLTTAALTGMRASELRGLTWKNVDFKNKQIHVSQRLDRYLQMGTTKTAAGDRTIPTAPPVFNALREWELACPKGPLKLVFPSGSGRGEYHSNIIRGFEMVQIKAGVVDNNGKPKYHFHSLRHFCASWLIEQNFSPKRLKALLGHTSISMSYDLYGHLFPSVEDDHAKFAAGALAIVGN